MTGWTGSLLCPAAVSGSTILVDSYASVQAALNALGSGGNNILSFTAGATYTISSPLSFANKSNWKISGNGATIKCANNMLTADGQWAFRIYDCTDYVVDLLIVDGNRANRAVQEKFGHGFHIQGGARGSFLTCTAKNVPNADGWLLTAKDNNGAIAAGIPQSYLFEDCIADNNYRNGFTLAYGNQIQIRGGQFKNTNGTNPEAGIDIEPDITTTGGFACRDILIEGAAFSVNEGMAINMTNAHSGATQVTRITVRGCRVDGNAGVTPGTWVRGGFVDIAAQDVLIEDNTIENFGANYTVDANTVRAAIHMQNAGFPLANITVNRNSLNTIDFVAAGIYVFNAAADTGPILISNNVFFARSDAQVFNGHPAITTLTNNTDSGVRTDPSPPPPWPVSLSHCVVGGGARGVVYSEQLTRATVTNNATPQTVLSIAHVPPSNTTWWYFGGGLLDTSTFEGHGVFARLRNQTQAVDYGNAKYSTNDITNVLPITFGAEQSYGASPSTQTISMDLWTSASETAGLDEIHLLGLQKLALDLYAHTDAEANENTAVFTDYVSLAGPASGQYLIIFTAETKAATGTNIEIRATDGTDFYGTANYSMYWNTAFDRFRTWSASIVTAPAGRTFKIQRRSTQAGQGVSIRNGRIFMLCLDSFRANYYSESLVRATTTSTAAVDKGLLTQVTGAGDHLAFAGMILDGNNNGFASNATFERDGAIGYSQVETVRVANERCGAFFTFRKENLTAASHTWKTRYFSENVALTTGAAQSTIAIIDINPFILSVEIDAVLRDSGALFGEMDAVLQGQTAKTALLGAVLTGTLAKAASLDAILQGITSTLLQVQLSAVLKGSTIEQASMDAVLVGGIPLTASIDAIFQKEQAKTAVVDAVLAGNLVSLTLVSFMSAKLLKQLSATAQIDAMLATGGLALSTRLDAILSAEWLSGSPGEDTWTNPGSQQDGWLPATPVEDGWSDA